MKPTISFAGHASRCLAAICLTLVLWLPAHAANPPLAETLKAARQFTFGQSREPLAVIEDEIRRASPAEYPAIENILLEAFNAPGTTTDAKRFFCRQLALVGSERCVPPLAPLLADPTLAHPARMALEVLPQEQAAEALRDALPKLDGKLLAGVVGSLGARRDTQAVPALGKLCTHSNAEVAQAALAALGAIGSSEALKTLNALKVPEAFSRALANARITALNRMAQAGDNAASPAGLQGLMDAKQPTAIRVAAGRTYILTGNAAESASRFVTALQGQDTALHSAALSAYPSLAPEAKAQTLRRLPELTPAAQALMLGLVADDSEAQARDAILSILKSAPDDNVRVAALSALARHGTADDVPLLAQYASGQGGTAAAAKRTLQRMSKPGVDAALIGLIEAPDGAQRAAALEALSARRVESALPTYTRLLLGQDPAMASEAAKALAVMGTPAQLGDLLQVMASTRSEPVLNSTRDAVKTICDRSANPEANSRLLVEYLGKAPSPGAQAALLPTLAYTGGQPALAAVLTAMKSTDPTVRLAAFRTLVAWPDATAASQLLEFARSSADPALAAVALRDGCLRLGELEETPTEQRVTILRGVFQTAQRPEEKKRALAALAEVPSLQALEQLRACTADAALKSDAVRALASLARGIGPVYPRQTLAALESIKAQPGSPDLEKTVLEAIKAVQSSGKSPEGFIIGWRVSGPYTAPEEDAAALFDTEFPPEKGGGEWRPLAAPASGVVDLGKPMPGENRTAYLQTVIESETSQEVLLELGSDDGVKAWLNGRVVHANNTTRGCAPGQDKVKVSLKQGANPLLLKITQGGGEFAACARLRSLDGGPLANVTIGPP